MPSTKRSTRVSPSEPPWDVDGEMPRTGFRPDYAYFDDWGEYHRQLGEIMVRVETIPGLRLTGISEKI